MGKEIATRFRSFIEDELTQLEQRAESIKKLIKEHEHDIAELNMNLSTVKSAKSECETECKDLEEQIRRKKSEITGVDYIEEAVTSYSSGRKKRKESATPPITPMSTPNKKRAATAATAAAAEPVGTTGKNSNNKKRESQANSDTPVKTFSRDNLGRFGKKESSGDGAKNTVNKDKQKNKNQTSKKDDTSDDTSESEDDISSSNEESDDSDDDYEDGTKAKRNKKNAIEGKTSKSKGGRGKKK